MRRFTVYSGSVLVGHSALEFGDPPMGVAFGPFQPATGYTAIDNECRTNHRDQSGLNLSVQTETGMVIPCEGVGILDYSQEQAACIEINILGVPAPLYSRLFAR